MKWLKDAHAKCAPIPLLQYSRDVENWVHKRHCSAAELELAEHVKSRAKPGARLLHVGVGSSYFAVLVADAVERIDGLTVNPEEVVQANKSGVAGYRVGLGDKHCPWNYLPFDKGPYDFIVDVDLTAYSCCHWHLVNLVHLYLGMLGPGGVILTSVRQFAARGADLKMKSGGHIEAMDVSELANMERDIGVGTEVLGKEVVRIWMPR